MFKLKSGNYRVQAERESHPGRTFIQVVRVDHKRMVWNQIPTDVQFNVAMRYALRVLGDLRGKALSQEQIEKIMTAANNKLEILT